MATLILFIMFCIVITYSNYKNFTEEATETAVDNIGSMMEVLNNNFELTLRDIDYVTALISNKVSTNMNGCVIDYLIMDDSDSAKLIQYRREVQDYLISMCSFKSYLQGMAIYDFNGRSVSYGITTTASEIVEQDWYKSLQDEKIDIMFSPPHYYTKTRNSPKSSQVFSIIRPVQHNGKTIGFVVADIKSSLLDDTFNINSINGYSIYVADNETGEIIYQPDNTLTLPSKMNVNYSNNINDYNFCEINDRQYLTVSQTSSFTPWTVIGIVPQDDIISGFVVVRNRMMGLVGIYGAIFIALILITTNFITRDLRRLSLAVESIDSNNMVLNLNIKSQDEVGLLYQQIQSMLLRIEGLIGNIKKTEKEKRKSEIKMLQSQINPHFLYNTLNTIKILASMQGISNIQTVCNALSNILHLNLDIRKFISVSEEMEYLTNYLQIQEYRYAGKVTYHFSVDENVKDCLIPKLLIQPIVENALQHGIAPLEYTGRLQIIAYQEEHNLKIIVKDNGKSFDETLIANHHYCGTESNHIGLSNIYTRLKLLFGNESDLLIFSESGLYTIIEVTLPIIRDGEEVAYD
jgi:sensor histidine kinase YesM